MLDEPDEFCRSGNQLLTLATPPELLAFRRWYLREFNAQLQGQPPLPWPEADRQQLGAWRLSSTICCLCGLSV
ncbi:MAG: hypothetical protein M3P34_03640 [Actinomycetota bacterium]|nr:hypothetical protein [Actinomycetota bacterium]